MIANVHKKADWSEVTAAEPCKICDHGRWCGRDGKGDETAHRCQRVELPPPGYRVVKPRDTKGATTFKLEAAQRSTSARVEHPAPGHKPEQKAGADTTDAVYRALLAALSLTDEHRDALEGRGLSQEQIERAGYRTLSRDRWRAVDASAHRGDDLLAVPGFVWDAERQLYTLKGSNGILIPCRDAQGRIVALKVRADEVKPGQPRYTYVSSRKHGGFGPGAPIHVPLGVTGPAEIARATEGELKADVASALTGLPTLSVPGAPNWRGAIPVLRKLKAKTVRLAFDADAATKPEVGRALAEFARALVKNCFIVELERWPAPHKGIDDALSAGVAIEVLTGDSATAALAGMAGAEQAPQDEPEQQIDDRIELQVTLDYHQLNPAAEKALKRSTKLYQRGGALVDVIRDPGSKEKGIERPAGTPRIRVLPQPLLREEMAKHISFYKLKRTEEGERKVRADVPSPCLSALFTRGQWDSVRPLEAITLCPVLRPDGTILATPGYDPMTRLLFETDIVWPSVPSYPTAADIHAAKALLEELVCDFPFAKPEHRSAAFALPLTVIARDAFHGPSPLFSFDAPQAGTGKTLLAEALTRPVTGMDLARTSLPEDDAECRKQITAIVMAGDRIVLIDNCGTALGCPSLDAALTGTTWKDRVLGRNELFEGPIKVVFVASGNNIQLKADTCRRVCHVRIEALVEKPEERSGFKHEHLLQWIDQERPRLLTAMLTILRGFCAAGRPDQGLKSWGSFEAWSALVRNAIVWAGWPDPAETRIELAQRTDRDAMALHALIAAWRNFDPMGKGHTTAEVLKAVTQGDNGGPIDRLRAAVAEFCPGRGSELPNSRSLGIKLTRMSRRVVGGFALDSRTYQGAAVWEVIKVGDSRDSRDSCYPPSRERREDGIIGGETNSRDSQESRDESEALFSDPVEEFLES